MTSNELKAALSTEPFQPFRLHFGSGKEIDVVNETSGGPRMSAVATVDRPPTEGSLRSAWMSVIRSQP